MAENEAGVAEQETGEEQVADYSITVEDIGPAAKKVTVEVPRERIDAAINNQYKELRSQAAIPGFRIGHAPRKLLEKRFSQDVKDQVAATLVRESYEKAISKNDLQVIGDPEFENQDVVKLPDEGSLSYSFQVEVQPNITLPDLTGLKVRKPKITINEANVDQAMQNLREQQGALTPVEDRGVEAGDYLIADVHLKVDGNVVSHQHDAQIVARPGRIAGLEVDDLATQVAGLRSGDVRSFTVKAPDTYPNEQLRGKDIEIEIALKDLKKLELAEINQAFLEDLGFENEQELRQALREQMEEKINFDIQQALREQVNRFLLENTQVDVPSKMSQRQTDRIINRRAMELATRGMSREQIEANIDRLRAGASDEAIRDLKLFFILQKVALSMDIDVSEPELNGRIAYLAAQRDRRPEKMKQEMQKDGSLADLFIQMRDQKAVDELLKKAQIEEVDVPNPDAATAEGSAAPSEPAPAE